MHKRMQWCTFKNILWVKIGGESNRKYFSSKSFQLNLGINKKLELNIQNLCCAIVSKELGK